MAETEDVDFDLIAAFIDDRLTGAERERVIKLLRDSEKAFEIYTDALRVREDLEVGPLVISDTPSVVPIDQGRRPSSFVWRKYGSLAAAAVLMVAIVPVWRARRDRQDLNAPASEITIAMTKRPDLSRTLVGDWDQRGWSVTRGRSSGLVDSTTEFRLGVRMADIEVAVAAGDTARGDRLLGEVIGALEGTDLLDNAKAEYTTLRASIRESKSGVQLAERAAHAERTLDDLLESSWFDLGRWLGAGELAASTQTKEFFDDPRTIRLLKATAERPDISASDLELLRQIALLAEQGVTVNDFETIRQHIRTLLRHFGG